jgi:ribose 1,5-bisphosphokinase PhnN
MAQVVELFGAPGAGKSSLVRALDGRRVAGRRVVSATRLARVPRRWPLGLLLRRDLAPAERRRALAARREDWAPLLGKVADGPLGRGGADDDPLRALHAPGWLAATLELRALAEAAPDDLVVVLDEGLVQRTAVVCGPDPADDVLAGYLHALPSTRLHVHLRQDPEVLAARLRTRDRVIDRHVGLGPEELAGSLAADVRLLARCADLLVAAGDPVLTLVTDGDVGAAADGVLAALGSTP